MIRFAHPWMLLLALPTVPLLWFSWSRIYGMARGRKAVAFALRGLVMLCLVAALAGPELRIRNQGTTLVALVDRSDSITEKARQQQIRWLRARAQELGPDDMLGIVAFGKHARVERMPSRGGLIPEIQSQTEADASDISAAMQLASGLFVEGKGRRMALLSDGNETLGDAAMAAQSAAVEGTPIDCLNLGGTASMAEVSVSDVSIRNEVQRGEPYELVVTAESTGEAEGEMLIERNGVIAGRQAVRLHGGSNRFVVPQTSGEAGTQRYRVTISAQPDRDHRNNVGYAFTHVRGPMRALVLQQDPGRRELSAALRSQGIEVDLAGSGSVPTRPEDLVRYDAVVFNDLAATTMLPSQMTMLASAIRGTGLGFAMVGGENSFLPGGYYGSPIADVLPVDLNIRQRKSYPSTTILVIADMSGSMSMIEDGVPKVRLAAMAAQRTAEMMSPLDKFGLVGSQSTIDWVVPITKLTDKGAVIGQIEQLSSMGGGIYIGPSMLFAEQALTPDTSKVRHLILLADGADSEDQDGALDTAKRMLAQKITTSVVAIGNGSDVPFLVQLAAAGGGRFYLADKASQLPAVFTQDAAIMSRSAIEEGAFLPRSVAGAPILQGIDPQTIPPLLGYCLVDPRPTSEVSMTTAKDDPLLATRQVGLGRTLAFTSDATAHWAKQWTGWPGFQVFWSQAVRSIARRTTSNRYAVQTEMKSGKAKVRVSATDPVGNPADMNPTSAQLMAPDGQVSTVALQQTAPGEYEGEFDTGKLGTYLVSVSEPSSEGGQKTTVSGVSIAYPAEYRVSRANEALLKKIARVSGGRMLRPDDKLNLSAAKVGVSIQGIAERFLVWAAVLWLLDIAVRRLVIPWAAIGRNAMAALRRAERPAMADAPGSVTALRAAKARVGEAAKQEMPVVVQPPPPTTSEPRPQPKIVPPPSGNASSRLLDAKRKRQKGDDPPA